MIAYSIEFYLMLDIVNSAWHQYDLQMVEKHRRDPPRRQARVCDSDK
jgi:hypothetical protein